MRLWNAWVAWNAGAAERRRRQAFEARLVLLFLIPLMFCAS